MEEEVKTVRDYLDIVKRRKWAIILPACAIFFLAFVVTLVLPRIYRSTSTILIEEQDIPPEYVKTTVTGYAEQRLQAISQRVMSSQNLSGVINRFHLYPGLKKKLTSDEIIEIMRKDIQFAAISVDVVDRGRGGSPTPMTIAFTLSYEGRSPHVVQQVANVLATLYLEENLRVRADMAREASKFLDDETKNMQDQLAQVDAKIAKFKEKHVNELPELVSINIQTLDRVEREVDMLKQQLRTAKEREGFLESQLAGIPVDASSQDRILLKDLKAKLIQLKSRYSDKHPDVRKMKTEIAELEERVKGTPAKSSGGRQRFQADDQPDNPAYVSFAAQLSSVQAEITTLQRQIDDLNRRRNDYYRRIESSPKVEEAYKVLMADRNNIQAKFDEMMKKTMEARVAQGLEKEQMGERFTIIDPARLPEKPVKPKVPAILLIGLFLGVGAGVGTAAMKEFNDRSVRDPKVLTELMRLPVLVTVPVIVTARDVLRQKIQRKRIAVIAAVIFVIGLILIHFFVVDLVVLWARLTRRL
ncbi:MAG: hypothetical protein KA801_06875 [Syntrophorhabdaceae bacterium]|nr:hypothetical protein [Syntrophorhabdaceae bacterium]